MTVGGDVEAAPSATDVAAALAQGRLSPLAHVEDCLARIARDDTAIGAWSYVDADGARERARAQRDDVRGGPLRGICVGVKDVLDTHDMPTEHGSALYCGHRPEHDAACVAALRATGAVVLGKTRTTEFASPVAVGVRNPLDRMRSAGVSSSGSAAAVAAGMVPLALGTQTGGSIIRPASYCGVVGFKPSLTAIDRTGIRHLRPALDTVGMFARTIDDAALLLSALVPASSAPGQLARPPRLSLCRTMEWRHARPEARAALAGAANAARAAGATVEEWELPPDFAHGLAAFRTIVIVETARTMAAEFARGTPGMNAWLRTLAADARGIADADYRAALDVAARCRHALAPLWTRCDAILTPAAAGEAIARLDGPDDPWFGPLWTLMHGPALTFPAGRGPSGLPIGVQLVGPPGADGALLAVGRWLQQALCARPAAA